MSNEKAFNFWSDAAYRQEAKNPESWTHQGFVGKTKILAKRAMWYRKTTIRSDKVITLKVMNRLRAYTAKKHKGHKVAREMSDLEYLMNCISLALAVGVITMNLDVLGGLSEEEILKEMSREHLRLLKSM